VRSAFLSFMISQRVSRAARKRVVFLFALTVVFGSVFFSYANLRTPEGAAPLRAYHPKFHPFDRGESAVYQGSWLGIPVASAEIHTSPVIVDGKKYYHAKVQARTWKYLELVWKMRDSVESVFDSQTMQPHRFVFQQRENRKKVDTTATFDPHTRKWSVHRQEGAKVRDFEFVSQDTLDPISAIYLARSVDFKIGDQLRLEVFGGKSRYLVHLDVVAKEPITVGSNNFDTYRIVPRVWNISNSGYAERVREITVWISADEKRRPVKIVSQAFVGNVSIELVEEKI
jgi:hypothetical protein